MNNNCNDNYDRIKKKIEEERERLVNCLILHPSIQSVMKMIIWFFLNSKTEFI